MRIRKIKKKKDFNIVIVGTGGQGLITLLRVLAETAMISNYEIRTSELHGLSQRGGSVEVHIRFGEKIHSPLVKKGDADIVIALESQEALRAIPFANKETIFLINNNPSPAPKILNSIVVSASDICKKEFGTDVVAGFYLMVYALSKKMIPLEMEFLEKAIKKTIPKKYLELNLKVFKSF